MTIWGLGALKARIPPSINSWKGPGLQKPHTHTHTHVDENVREGQGFLADSNAVWTASVCVTLPGARKQRGAKKRWGEQGGVACCQKALA
eukprot:1159715-Pelagomonas_calceolata.AAC.3